MRERVLVTGGLALTTDRADHQVMNIGTGQRTTLLDLLDMLRDRLDPDRKLDPVMTGQFREGDIRHCYANIGRAREVLGYEPKVPFTRGVDLLVEWARGQSAVDRSERALAELRAKQLVR